MAGIFANVGYVILMMLFFGFTIFVHEFGHFITALKLGLVIDTFSIGFGPSIWEKKINGIRYKIGWIPFGGYVALPQLDPSEMENIQGKSNDKDAGDKPVPRNLPAIAPWKKIIVSVSGALGNIIFAVVLAYVIYFAPSAVTIEGGSGPIAIYVAEDSEAYALGIRTGDKIVDVNGNAVDAWYDVRMECLLGKGESNSVTLSMQTADGEQKAYTLDIEGGEMGQIEYTGISEVPSCVLGAIIEGGSADAAGLKEGDAVLELDGVKVGHWEHFVKLVKERGDKTVNVIVSRQGEIMTLSVTPKYSKEYDRVMIGVQAGLEFCPPWMYHKKPFAQIKRDSTMLFRMLKAFVTPKEAGAAAKGVGGPIAIFVMLWMALKTSLLSGLGFLRMLNINLAIFNLLPIPILDGGHVMFSLWECVTKRKAHPKLVAVLMNTFMVLLLLVAVLVTYRDAFVFIPKLWKARRDAIEKVESPDTQTDASSEDSDNDLETQD